MWKRRFSQRMLKKMKCPIPLPVLQTMWKTQPENTGRKKKIITNKNNKTRLCAVQVAMYLRDIFLYAFSLRCAFAGHFTCCLVKDCNVKIQKCTANFKPFNQSHNMHLAKSSFFFFFSSAEIRIAAFRSTSHFYQIYTVSPAALFMLVNIF